MAQSKTPVEIKKQEKTSVEIEFNYATLELEPYVGGNGDSSKLLKELFLKLNDPEFPRSKRVIDRFKRRAGSEKKLLVHISAPMEKGGLRCFGKIALIKNKAPMLLSGKFNIEEIEKEENKEFIEITNYVINFHSKDHPIIMLEYNYSGPRLSDVEFYFRQVAREYRIAKSITSIPHLDIDYSKLSKEMENVLKVEVKVKSNEVLNTQKVDWHKSLRTLNDETGFQNVRLKLYYGKEKKDKVGKLIRNIKGLGFARGIVDWLRKDERNIKHIQDLKMEYQLSGSDEICKLDFLKSKTTSIVSIPLFTKTHYRPLDFKTVVGLEFSNYVDNGVASKHRNYVTMGVMTKQHNTK